MTNTATEQSKSDQAAAIVRKHMLGSAAAGLVPIPGLNAGIVAGLQLRMLSKLAELYEVDFNEQRANAIIGTLAGVSVASTATGFLRLIPGVGTALFGLAAISLLPASTYALGQLFIKHFESGGTFLTFDESRAQSEYSERLDEGRKLSEQSYVGVKP